MGHIGEKLDSCAVRKIGSDLGGLQGNFRFFALRNFFHAAFEENQLLLVVLHSAQVLVNPDNLAILANDLTFCVDATGPQGIAELAFAVAGMRINIGVRVSHVAQDFIRVLITKNFGQSRVGTQIHLRCHLINAARGAFNNGAVFLFCLGKRAFGTAALSSTSVIVPTTRISLFSS